MHSLEERPASTEGPRRRITLRLPGTRSLAFAILAIYPTFLVGFSFLDAIWPQRAGISALIAIAMPVAFPAALVLVPFAVLRGSGVLRIALLVALAVGVARFGGEWTPIRAASAGSGLTIPAMTWNLEVHSRPPARGWRSRR